MCGIFGFISSDADGPSLKRLRRIAEETQERGRHAFGLAWLDAAGAIHSFKRPGAATACLGDLERCRHARIVIGHCRYATHGDPRDNRNNHPHAAGSGCIVHNGVVRNYQSLIAAHELQTLSACDSEVLGLLIAAGAGPLCARTARTVSLAEGPLALLGLWPGKLVLARRGNPLHFGQTERGLYFGSLPGELPGKVLEARDEFVSVLSLGRGGLHLAGRSLNAP